MSQALNNVIIGIDIGFSGAIAVLDAATGSCLALHKMPTVTTTKKAQRRVKIKENGVGVVKNKHKVKSSEEIDETAFREILKPYIGNAHVYFEKAQVMPKQGISSSGRYMMSFGFVRGVCIGLGIPYTLVHPVVWKKKILMHMAKDKGGSLVRAKQLFPNTVLRASSLCKKDDHNMAEALLIAEYGRTDRMLDRRENVLPAASTVADAQRVSSGVNSFAWSKEYDDEAAIFDNALCEYEEVAASK